MKNELSSYWRKMANGTTTSAFACLLRAFLTPFSLLYRLLQAVRVLCYQTKLCKSYALPRPVVSVGNITVGGTGKTPVTAWIATYLLEQGFRVTVLSRGYGGTLEGQCAVVSDGTRLLLTTAECGDEPFLLASSVAGLAVVIGADRYQAGCLALERLQPDIFLLDDGFQHLRLQRDLNILLQDYDKPLGNGSVLPAGLLREPAGAAERADLIIHTRCPHDAAIPLLSGTPAIISRHELTEAVPLSGGEAVVLAELRGRRALAFAGIAEPEHFFSELRNQGIDLVKTVVFADHADYAAEQIAALTTAFQDSGAVLMLTTGKDGVKLKGVSHELSDALYVVRLELAIDEPARLTAALMKLLQK